MPKAQIGSPAVVNTYYDVNNNGSFLPANFSAQPYTVFTDNTITRTDPSMRIGIVYSDTTAANYFSATAYSDLFMAAQNQAMQAGIPFDLLTEADLTDLAKLANYDALVFPSFTNVQSSDASRHHQHPLQATKQFGIGLITSGDFMTNDQTGAPLAGQPLRQHEDLLRRDPRSPAAIRATSRSIPATRTRPYSTNTAPGALIQSYSGVGWTAYQSVSGTGQTIATETVAGVGPDLCGSAGDARPAARTCCSPPTASWPTATCSAQAIDYVANGSRRLGEPGYDP